MKTPASFEPDVPSGSATSVHSAHSARSDTTHSTRSSQVPLMPVTPSFARLQQALAVESPLALGNISDFVGETNLSASHSSPPANGDHLPASHKSPTPNDDSALASRIHDWQERLQRLQKATPVASVSVTPQKETVSGAAGGMSPLLHMLDSSPLSGHSDDSRHVFKEKDDPALVIPLSTTSNM